MAHEIDKENKTIRNKKDCKTCISIKSCKFHAKMSELCRSNEFYQMTEYLEWNNSLAAFELHASCQFYHYRYEPTIEGNHVTLATDPEMISSILHATPRPDNSNSFSHDIKTDEVKYNWYNPTTKESGSVVLKLSEILDQFTYTKLK